jgi:hypothetical protein
MAILRRDPQRRLSILVRCIDRGTAVQQQGGDLGMALRGGKIKQRGTIIDFVINIFPASNSGFSLDIS